MTSLKLIPFYIWYISESTIGSLSCQRFSYNHMFPWRRWTLHPIPSLSSKLDPFHLCSWNICKSKSSFLSVVGQCLRHAVLKCGLTINWLACMTVNKFAIGNILCNTTVRRYSEYCRKRIRAKRHMLLPEYWKHLVLISLT